MITPQRILSITIILIGLGILIWLSLLIHSPLNKDNQSPAKPALNQTPTQTPQPTRLSHQEISKLIEQTALAELQTPSLNEALAKFKKMSEDDKTAFIEGFLTAMGTEVLDQLLGEPKSSEVLRGLPTEHQRFITQLLAEISGLSPKQILYLGDLTSIATILGLQEPMLSQPVTISFTTTVNEDNTPQDNRLVFKPSEHIIYACFPTKDGLKGLRYISIKWIRLDSGKIFYQGYKLIDPTQSYNYIWVKNNHSWPTGRYEVRVSNLKGDCLAQGTYEVKN